jgi:hypothetical protein
VRLILPFLLGTQHVSDICYCMKCMNVKTPFLKCCSHIDTYVAGLVVIHSYHYSMLYPIYDSLLCFMSCLTVSRWRTLCKENLLNYHLDFCGSLQFLMKKLNILEGGVIVPEDTDVVDNSDVDDDGEESETEVLEHVKLETIAADNDDDYRLSGGVRAEKRKIAAVTTVIDLDDQSKSKKHKKNKKVKEDKKEKKDKKSKKSKKVKKEKN